MGKRFRLGVLNSHPIQYFAPLYKRIAETDDIDVTVYYCSRQGLEKGFVDPGFGKEVVWDVPLLDGYRHKFLPAIGGDRGVRGFLNPFNPSIVRELWRERYDALLIHGHNSASNLLALVAAKLTGTRVFMRGETHLALRRSALKRVIRGPAMALLYRLCDACLYIGTRNREFYSAHGVADEKQFFVPYTVDNEAFAAKAERASAQGHQLRMSLGIERTLPVILYASKLTERKRPADVLRAHAELARRGIKAALVIVGDGEQRKRLEEQARELATPNVSFAGFVNQDEIPAYFSLAEVFVLPSENEPWGLIINEAMSCGVPVVTTSEVGAAVDLVENGVTGFAYPAGDVRALADSLQRILEDETAARGMGEQCRRRMSRWSFAEDIEGIREALAATARPAMEAAR